MEILRLKHEPQFQAALRLPPKALLELAATAVASFKGVGDGDDRLMSLVVFSYLGSD